MQGRFLIYTILFNPLPFRPRCQAVHPHCCRLLSGATAASTLVAAQQRAPLAVLASAAAATAAGVACCWCPLLLLAACALTASSTSEAARPCRAGPPCQWRARRTRGGCPRGSSRCRGAGSSRWPRSSRHNISHNLGQAGGAVRGAGREAGASAQARISSSRHGVSRLAMTAMSRPPSSVAHL